MSKLKLVLAAFLLAPALAFGQVTIGTGATRAAPVANQSSLMPARIYVNPDTLPKRNPGSSIEKFVQTCTGTYADCHAADTNSVNTPNRYAIGYNSGSFRVACGSSHFAFDDPIVYPGERGRTHAHQFSGNNSTSSGTDVANLENIGTSTCGGGILNRSGYWWPLLAYHCPAGSTDGCTRARDGEVIPAGDSNFYYKCAYAFNCQTGGNGGTPIQWFPVGFNVIAGNPNAIADQDGRVLWRCNNAAGTEMWRGGHIPNTTELAGMAGGPCVDLEPSVTFPICWDGVNARSPGLSQSHVDTAAGYLSQFNTGCQGNTAFPVLLPELGLNIHIAVNTADIPYLRLSSDWPKSSGRAAGITMHSDYIHGWSSRAITELGGLTVKEAILRECFMSNNGGPPYQHSDCHNNILGSPGRDGKWWSLY